MSRHRSFSEVTDYRCRAGVAIPEGAKVFGSVLVALLSGMKRQVGAADHLLQSLQECVEFTFSGQCCDCKVQE